MASPIASAFSPNLFFYYFATLSILCFTFVSSAGFSIRLIPRFSPESPFYPGNLTAEEKIHEVIKLTNARADHLHSQSSQSSPNNIRLGVHIDYYLYVSEIVVGTPPQPQYLVLDTGSGVIWTQCTPCINCFQQTIPIFNPTESSSYQKIPCGIPCMAPFQCVNGECTYSVNYIGGSSTKGIVSTDKFSFKMVDGTDFSFDDMIFGCANDNQHISFSNRRISGILALNGFRHSFVEQLEAQIQGRFAYCLTGLDTSSLLRFGEDIVMPPGPDVKTLNLVRQNLNNNFYLNLVDITVGTNRMRLPPGIFRLRTDGTGGFVIDSGAAFSVLDDVPYNMVMNEFDRQYKLLGRERVEPVPGLEFCYRYDPSFRDYVGMTFNFAGSADYVVQPLQMILEFQTGSFCVMLYRRQDRNILGAWQQHDMRIVYDLNQRTLQFKPDDCSRDTA